MNAERHEVDSNRKPNGPAAKHTTNGDGAKTDHFVHRAMAAADGLAAQFDEWIKRNPHAALGAAGLVGAGVGVVLSSRILRAAFTASATAAAVELTRAFVRRRFSS
jgi:hypothetical protein